MGIFWEYIIKKIMEISSASNYDNIVLRANVRALFNDRYHCEDAISGLRAKIKDPKILEQKIKMRARVKGCDQELSRTIDRIDNIRFTKCLCNYKHPLFNTLMTLHDNYERGVLPFEGSLMDQPAQIIELLQVMNHSVVTEKHYAQERAKDGRKH